MQGLPNWGWWLGLGGMLLAQVARAHEPAIAERPAPRPVYTAEQLARLVEELNADSFAAREDATRQLRAAGAPAIGRGLEPELTRAHSGLERRRGVEEPAWVVGQRSDTGQKKVYPSTPPKMFRLVPSKNRSYRKASVK